VGLPVNKKSLLSVFLTAIMLSGLILASAARFGTVQASTGDSGIPKPAVPEFTLSYVDHSYYVPPTYGIDPYTGKNITISSGGYVKETTIDISIKNQPFASYNVSGNYTSLFYNIRFKGHYEDEWQTYPMDPLDGYINASHSDYTIVSLPYWRTASIPVGGQVDVQVQALIGYDNQVEGYAGGWKTVFHHFTGEASDWSNTQTITISEIQTPTSPPATTPTPTPTPSQEPQQTEQIEPIVGAAIVVAVIVVGASLLIYLIKRK
jgi:hypothetical protein